MARVTASNMAAVKFNPQDIKLTKALYEAELSSVKAVQPHPDHKLAVDRYKKDLIRVLKKITPGGWYYP